MCEKLKVYAKLVICNAALFLLKFDGSKIARDDEKHYLESKKKHEKTIRGES